MRINHLRRDQRSFPDKLKHIPAPPAELYVAGPLRALLERPCLAIVGNRLISPYGRHVTAKLAARLAEQGIVIVSGLAIGVDAVAHQAALEAGGQAIAVLPSPLERVAPATNQWLADKILAHDGALVSEYPPGSISFKQNFIARNRLMAGLADAVLITEAGEKSGSLHTARFALEQGKDVLAVPGNVTSPGAVGTNNLLKTGAAVVTDYRDVLQSLGLVEHGTPLPQVHGRNAHEQLIIDGLLKGVTDGEELLLASKLDVAAFNQALMMLEIGGKIRCLGANQWAIR